jgi:DnaJ-class molecular chaperone
VCKGCNGEGVVDCPKCKGSGRVQEGGGNGFGFGRLMRTSVPCTDCKQKGKIACPGCAGQKSFKCKTCDGRKTRKSVPTEEYKPFLQADLCPECQGRGSAFGRMAYPCPACEGLGRFATR